MTACTVRFVNNLDGPVRIRRRTDAVGRYFFDVETDTFDQRDEVEGCPWQYLEGNGPGAGEVDPVGDGQPALVDDGIGDANA